VQDFVLADADNDGSLSREEFETMMRGQQADVSTEKLKLQLEKILKKILAVTKPKFDAYEVSLQILITSSQSREPEPELELEPELARENGQIVEGQ
jgi:Ca2+-binding EF-hand superfamily protein